MSTSLSLFDLKPGKVLLERYRIQRPHRESGMSATFSVEDSQSDEQRELQAFPAAMFEGAEQAAAFAERMQAWRDLNSEAVLQLRDIRALDDGAVLYVTDFPVGESLRTWMAEHPRMEVAEVVALASCLLRGLSTAHEAGLIHGDIKPASIWFEPGEGRGTLVDAGVTPGMWAAKHLGTRTALIGTPYYAPIEQFSGDSPDELSDQYNLGTVMYELLTGVLPWSGKGYIEVFQSKMQEAAPPMSQMAPSVEVPRELENVVARSLRAKRRERFATAADFLSALESVELD